MWTTSILPESCRLVIEETLPRGMYVDPDQLRDLSEMGILNTYVPGNIIIFDNFPSERTIECQQISQIILMNVIEIFVARIDVEAPEFESESFRVMVFRNLDIQVISNKFNLKIPSVLYFTFNMPSNEILISYLLIFEGKSEDNFRRITSSFTVSQARVSSG